MLRPRAATDSGTPSISASEGKVPATSMTFPAARIRATSWFWPRFTVASGVSSRAVSVKGAVRIRPVPVTPTDLPMRASVDRMSAMARSAVTCMRGST